jgi:threonine aldolase
MVHFCSDGVALSPVEYARLLTRLAEDGGIVADEFSREGVVATLEERMAAMLGKEMAVFMPSGTLANNLALRLLAQRGRRVLVQRESHIYNDAGDCTQELSGLTLIPPWPRARDLHTGRSEGRNRPCRGRSCLDASRSNLDRISVRRILGEVFDFAEMQRIAAFAQESSIGLHLDGARLFLASAYGE